MRPPNHATSDAALIPHRGLATLARTLAAVLFCVPLAQTDAPAQTRWSVDPQASLAWWQMSPNLNHLWATTCPEEPSWRPGEGRSAGWTIPRGLRPSEHGYAAIPDTVNVPLYPRYEVLPVCTHAVAGEILAADTMTWRGVRGEITVRADALITGDERRDAFTQQAVLHTNRYPHLRYAVDSVVNVSRRADTLRGTALGVFTLHGTAKPITAALRAWPEAGGLRVLARFRMPASDMVSEFGLSSYALGLGVGVAIWQDLFMGVDVLLREETPAP